MAWGTWRIAGRLSPVPKHQEAGSVLHGTDHAAPTTSFPISAFSRLGGMSLLQGESTSLRHQAGTVALGSQLAGKTSDVRGEGPSCYGYFPKSQSSAETNGDLLAGPPSGTPKTPSGSGRRGKAHGLDSRLVQRFQDQLAMRMRASHHGGQGQAPQQAEQVLCKEVGGTFQNCESRAAPEQDTGVDTNGMRRRTRVMRRGGCSEKWGWDMSR